MKYCDTILLDLNIKNLNLLQSFYRIDVCKILSEHLNYDSATSDTSKFMSLEEFMHLEMCQMIYSKSLSSEERTDGDSTA